MVFPLVVHIFNITVPFHLIMDILSTIVGSALYWLSSKHDGISPQRREYLLIGAGIGALIGSRLIGSLENPILFLHPPALIYYYMSKTIIGGIAGGILGIEGMKLIIGHHESTGDRITIPLIVAIILGRIGCLFTGVTDGTVGNICNYMWCFNQGDNIPRHPTSLYEIIILGLLLLYFLYLRKKVWKNGIMFRVFIIVYFSFRFLMEFIKPVHSLFLSLSVIQIVCVLYVLWYTYDIYRINKKDYGNTK